MSGLDESMSDVTPRKKYPFELEKALHNVMFIQHHIQRQDEFNAVSSNKTVQLTNFKYLIILSSIMIKKICLLSLSKNKKVLFNIN